MHNPTSASHRRFASIFSAALGISLLASPAILSAQQVPPALAALPAAPPTTGSNGEKLIGMPKFHQPLPYDIDEHTGYKQIFDGKSFDGWDADPTIWRVENGLMVGETLEGKPKGNNYIVYRGDKTRDFDLKLQMKIEKGGGGGIQYRSATGVPWTRSQPTGVPPYDLKFMMTGPQADFWFPVTAPSPPSSAASGTQKTPCRASSPGAARSRRPCPASPTASSPTSETSRHSAAT